mgnify:CR=1 FL=1
MKVMLENFKTDWLQHECQIHFLHSQLNYFPDNLDFSEEQGKKISSWYQRHGVEISRKEES